MTVINLRTLIEVHTPEFTMFLLHINSSPQNCSSLLISKVSCWNGLNLEIMLQSKKLLGSPRRPKKHFDIRRGWSHLPTSQLTCLPPIFNNPLWHCKLEPTAAAPCQHLSLQTTAPSSSPDAGGLRHHFTVTPTLQHLAEATLSTTVPHLIADLSWGLHSASPLRTPTASLHFIIVTT